jgi:acetyl/propionyl-CoA carboxylase alpha subunit
VPPFYDSLMAKVIAHAATRSLTLERMRHAIAAARVVGVCTNLAFHVAVLRDPEFQAGGVDTGFVARLLERSPLRTEATARG